MLIQMNGGVQLTFMDVNAKNAEIRLYNSAGQMTIRQQGGAKDGQKVFVDMNDLSSGVYLIQVINDHKILLSQQVIR